MGFGRLTSKQKLVLKTYIDNQIVYDLGAGDCSLSEEMINLGARQVIAIDSRPLHCDPRITIQVMPFREFLKQDPEIEISVVSWPNNYHNAELNGLIDLSNLVIYLGKNTDGSACGSPSLFQQFKTRKVLAYVPDRKNTMIVYGRQLEQPRKLAQLYGEEMAGITMDMQAEPLNYENVEKFFPAEKFS